MPAKPSSRKARKSRKPSPSSSRKPSSSPSPSEVTSPGLGVAAAASPESGVASPLLSPAVDSLRVSPPVEPLDVSPSVETPPPPRTGPPAGGAKFPAGRTQRAGQTRRYAFRRS
ncbi:hypothetical protein [Micromonospora sp. NPDC001898]|uniref:hypothetical protein n=1 Tax=Micromonospora sp. NPDC001898 TaxID=3364221 RepID=UPI0036CC43AB